MLFTYKRLTLRDKRKANTISETKEKSKEKSKGGN
jgi:hypothetical protein